MNYKDTLLSRWLKAAPADMKRDLAARAGVSVNYLHLLAGVHRENPKVRLALAIMRAANCIRAESGGAKQNELPLLTIDSLASPTKREPCFRTPSPYVEEITDPVCNPVTEYAFKSHV